MNTIECTTCGYEFDEIDTLDGLCVDCQINEAGDEEDRYAGLF